MTSLKIIDFWNDYLKFVQSNNQPIPEEYEAWHFSNNETSANSLAKLVAEGTKTATASLVWSYEAENSSIPQPGDLSIITLWDETPVCIIETTEISIHPFNAVPASFAYDEGEGDRSLNYWRYVHTHFFTEECIAIGRTPGPDMPVVCEQFKVVFLSDFYERF
ncbi:MAG TPA: ASCH domain-containing protein [Leptolinea sp.]